METLSNQITFAASWRKALTSQTLLLVFLLAFLQQSQSGSVQPTMQKSHLEKWLEASLQTLVFCEDICNESWECSPQYEHELCESSVSCCQVSHGLFLFPSKRDYLNVGHVVSAQLTMQHPVQWMLVGQMVRTLHIVCVSSICWVM